MNPNVIKTVVDALFTELEAATASRPVLGLALVALRHFVDSALLSRVAAKLTPPM
jgi:hypothetical protein